jgi:hypothetical protein
MGSVDPDGVREIPFEARQRFAMPARVRQGPRLGQDVVWIGGIIGHFPKPDTMCINQNFEAGKQSTGMMMVILISVLQCVFSGKGEDLLAQSFRHPEACLNFQSIQERSHCLDVTGSLALQKDADHAE